MSFYSGASSQLSEGLVQLEPDDPEPEPTLKTVPPPEQSKSKQTKKKRTSCQRGNNPTADMVRVYSQPPSMGQRQLTPSQSTTSGPGANGFQVRGFS